MLTYVEFRSTAFPPTRGSRTRLIPDDSASAWLRTPGLICGSALAIMRSTRTLVVRRRGHACAVFSLFRSPRLVRRAGRCLRCIERPFAKKAEGRAAFRFAAQLSAVVMARSRQQLWLVYVAATLTACQSIADDVKPPTFDRTDLYDDGQYTYTISTNSEESIKFKIRLSKAADDIHCNNATIFSQETVSSATPSEHHFRFSQMGSPHVALYEWHLCIEVDGVTYKGWRGFDPGPGSILSVDCELDIDRLIARETGTYLCHLNDVSINHDNFGEYAAVCDPTTEHCNRFESADAMRLWDLLNRERDLMGKITLAYFAHATSDKSEPEASYSSANPMAIYLSVAGEDPSSPLIEQLGRLGITVYAGSEWEVGKGVHYWIGRIVPLSETSLSVVVDTYCGPLCASGTTVTLELEDGRWRVVSMDMNWISLRRNQHGTPRKDLPGTTPPAAEP